MANRGKNATRKSVAKSAGIRKGRFKRGMDPLFAAFNASIHFDRRLYEEDIRGSVAHVRMLAATGIIPKKDAKSIEKGLKEVLADLNKEQFVFSNELEDIHINIEHALREKIGHEAGKLHTARSRNDQVALDLRLYIKKQTVLVMEALLRLCGVLVDKSEDSLDVILPGYTHLQRAQPVRLAHHLMAYFEMFRRDWGRFRDSYCRLDEMPLGSAALAGTTFPIDRKMVARTLGFSKVSANSMDSVSDRDFGVEFLFNSSLVMMHLSRLAEEMILWSTTEFGFCTLPEEFCSGSSIMPQKRNPDACELIRGKTGRVYGDLMAILTVLKALPLTYNKDLQEDKEPIFDAADTVRACVEVMTAMIPGTKFHAEVMQAAASDPAMAATDLADRLVRRGIPFREAHARVGTVVRKQVSKKRSGRTEDSIPGPLEIVEARNHQGGTARDRVVDQIRSARSFLQENAETTIQRK